MEKVMKKSLICKICQHITATKDELHEHMKRTHNPKYSCPECSFCCMIKNHFDYHYQSKHSGERRYECTECQYRCITRTMLANHMKTHSHYLRFRSKAAAADLKVHADEDCHDVELAQDGRIDLAIQSNSAESKETKHNTDRYSDEREPKKKRKFNVVPRICFSLGKEVSSTHDLDLGSIPTRDNLIGIISTCHVGSASSASSQLVLSNMEQIPVFPYGSAVTPDCRGGDAYFSKNLDRKFSRLPSAVGCSSEGPPNQVDRANVDSFRCDLCSFEAVSGDELLLHTSKIHRLTAKKSFDPVLSVSSCLLQLDRSVNAPDQPVTGMSIFSQNFLNAIVPNDIDTFNPSSSGYEHSVDTDSSVKASQFQLCSQRTSNRLQPNKLQPSIECGTSELVAETGAIETERKTSKHINCAATDQSSDQQNIQKDLGSDLHEDYDNSVVSPLDLSFSHSLPKVNEAFRGRGNQSESELAVSTVRSRRKGRTRKLDLSAFDNKETESTKLNAVLVEPMGQSVAAFDMLEYEKPMVKNSLEKKSPLIEVLLSYSVGESKDSIFVNEESERTHDYSSLTDFNTDSLKNQLPLTSVSPNSLLYESEENRNSDCSRVNEISTPLPPFGKINSVVTDNRTSKNDIKSKTRASSDGGLEESHQRWKYKCQHCLMNFKDSLMHQLHMGFHNFENPFRCNYCGKDNGNHLDFCRHLGEVAHPNLPS